MSNREDNVIALHNRVIDTDQMEDFPTTAATTPDTLTIWPQVVIFLLRQEKQVAKARSHIRLANAGLVARLVDPTFQY